MEKELKLNLIQRSLGLKHKLKVHESMKQPETHEDMARMFLAQWELEDELVAIESILHEQRQANVAEKKSKLMKHGFIKAPKSDPYAADAAELLSDLPENDELEDDERTQTPPAPSKTKKK